MQDLWKGNANAWECDELGHLNVRYYLANAMQAIGTLADRLGLSEIFTRRATATLLVETIHIRFLAEARPGAPLAIEGGVSDWDEAGVEVLLIMRHAARDKIAATFRIRLSHIAPHTGRPFPWPKRLEGMLDTLRVDIPDIAQPRGLHLDEPAREEVSLTKADELGMQFTGLGRFSKSDTDLFDRMLPELTLGKVSDSAIHFSQGFPRLWQAHQGDDPVRIGNALLECHIRIHSYAQTGQGFVMRSGLKAANEKVRNLVHWILNPVTGEPLWTIEGVSCDMDLDARKMMLAQGEDLKVLQDNVIAGISI